MTDPYWRDRAACRLTNARDFDPIEGRPTAADITDQLQRARAVCKPCPTKPECIDAAVADGDSGIRAGVYMDQGRPVGDPKPPGRPSLIDKLRGAA